jgi:hypothetical protein
MAKTNQSRKIWVLALIGIVALILVGGLVSLQPYGSPLNWLIRGGGADGLHGHLSARRFLRLHAAGVPHLCLELCSSAEWQPVNHREIASSLRSSQ